MVIAKEKQDECERNSWKFSIGNHEVILRDQAASIVSFLKQFGDIAMEFAPPQASIPWAAIKGAMQVRMSSVTLAFLWCGAKQASRFR